MPRFAEWVEALGPWGPAAFVAGYAVAVVAFVPGSLLTLAAGAIYVVASIGMLPGTLLYVYSGKVAGELARLAGSSAVPHGAGYYAVVGLGFAATAIVTVLVHPRRATRVARRALKEESGE